jgi:hypothetical protein
VIWRQSVKHYSLSDRRIARRALNVVGRGLAACGAVLEHKDVMNRINAEPVNEAVYLPAFTAFTNNCRFKPYEWLTPRPSSDMSSFVMAYEAFVQQDLGTVREPGKVPEYALLDNEASVTKSKVNVTDRATEWYTPALLLMAMAQNYADKPIKTVGDSYRIDIHTAKLEVTPEGCYSNMSQGFRKASALASDVDSAVFEVDGFYSADRTVMALAKLADDADYGVMYALNVVGRAMSEGTLRKLDILKMLNKAYGRSVPGPAGADILSIADEALNVLKQPMDNPLPSLHALLVPGMYSSREFRRLFGDPQVARMVRPSTKESWTRMIQDRLLDATTA